jgi:hypothetical protein
MADSVDVVVVGYRPGPETTRLLSFLPQLTRLPHKLHYCDNTGNPKSLSAAWNDLAAQGSAPFIAFLNSDAFPCPGWDLRMSSILQRHVRVGAVVPKAVGVPSARVSGREFPVSDPATPEQLEAIANALDGNLLYDYGHECAPFYSVMVRRLDFDALLGFDERLRFYGQDHDLQDRLRAKGMKIVQAAGCPFTHGNSAATKAAIQHGDIDIMEEYTHIGRILGPLRSGHIRRWHTLSDKERRAVRADPAYAMSGKAR